jgi:hypothetical protein
MGWNFISELRPPTGMLFIPRKNMSMESRSGMILTGETEELWQTCVNATLSTTNRTWTDPSGNPGLSDERPATNFVSHGTAGI